MSEPVPPPASLRDTPEWQAVIHALLTQIADQGAIQAHHATAAAVRVIGLLGLKQVEAVSPTTAAFLVTHLKIGRKKEIAGYKSPSAAHQAHLVAVTARNRELAAENHRLREDNRRLAKENARLSGACPAGAPTGGPDAG